MITIDFSIGTSLSFKTTFPFNKKDVNDIINQIMFFIKYNCDKYDNRLVLIRIKSILLEIIALVTQSEDNSIAINITSDTKKVIIKAVYNSNHVFDLYKEGKKINDNLQYIENFEHCSTKSSPKSKEKSYIISISALIRFFNNYDIVKQINQEYEERLNFLFS